MFKFMQLLHISQYMCVLLWQVHERVNDAQYDYKLLTLIYAFFNYMYACISLFVGALVFLVLESFN